LIIATKSLTFCPDDSFVPVYRILLNDVASIKKTAAKGFSKKVTTIAVTAGKIGLIDSKLKIKVSIMLYFRRGSSWNR